MPADTVRGRGGAALSKEEGSPSHLIRRLTRQNALPETGKTQNLPNGTWASATKTLPIRSRTPLSQSVPRQFSAVCSPACASATMRRSSDEPHRTGHRLRREVHPAARAHATGNGQGLGDFPLAQRRGICSTNSEGRRDGSLRDDAGLCNLADRRGNDFGGGFVSAPAPTHPLPRRRWGAYGRSKSANSGFGNWLTSGHSGHSMRTGQRRPRCPRWLHPSVRCPLRSMDVLPLTPSSSSPRSVTGPGTLSGRSHATATFAPPRVRQEQDSNTRNDRSDLKIHALSARRQFGLEARRGSMDALRGERRRRASQGPTTSRFGDRNSHPKLRAEWALDAVDLQFPDGLQLPIRDIMLSNGEVERGRENGCWRSPAGEAGCGGPDYRGAARNASTSRWKTKSGSTFPSGVSKL